MTTTTTDRPADYGYLTSRHADLVRAMESHDSMAVYKAAIKLSATARIGRTAEEIKQVSLELIQEAVEEE